MISNKYVALFVVGFFVYIALMILIAYLTSPRAAQRVRITSWADETSACFC